MTHSQIYVQECKKMGYLMGVVYAKTTDIYFNVKYNGENADIDQC